MISAFHVTYVHSSFVPMLPSFFWLDAEKLNKMGSLGTRLRHSTRSHGNETKYLQALCNTQKGLLMKPDNALVEYLGTYLIL